MSENDFGQSEVCVTGNDQTIPASVQQQTASSFSSNLVSENGFNLSEICFAENDQTIPASVQWQTASNFPSSLVSVCRKARVDRVSTYLNSMIQRLAVSIFGEKDAKRLVLSQLVHGDPELSLCGASSAFNNASGRVQTFNSASLFGARATQEGVKRSISTGDAGDFLSEVAKRFRTEGVSDRNHCEQVVLGVLEDWPAQTRSSNPLHVDGYCKTLRQEYDQLLEHHAADMVADFDYMND